MRSILKAALLAIGLLAWPAVAPAQEEAAPSPAPAASPPTATAAPSAVNPRGPIPYTTYQRRNAPRPQARPAARVAGAAAASAPAATTSSVGVVAPLPVAATGARLLPGEALPPAELESFVDGVVKDAMDREHIAGVTVAVVQNGQVLLKKGYGFASLSPQRRVDPDRTLFRIASISKTFTWIALMREVEAGRIRINAPVNLYLPERQQVKDQGYDTPVRVEHLMDHSAGFEDRALGHLFERNFNRERPLTEYLRQERPRRVHAPGAMSSYSNYGVGLAGLAVSYVTGKPFERAIEDAIIIPLGMSRTTFRERHPVKAGLPAPMAPSLAGDVSEAFRWTPSGFQRRDYEYIGHIAPAASASTTSRDMSRYMLMLLNNGTLDNAVIFGPRAAKAFRTPQRRTPPGVNGWAHGFIVSDLGGHAGYGHNGATLSFMSNMVVVPDLNLGVFISTNTETGEALAQRLPERLVQQFYAPPRPFPRAGSPDLVRARDAFEGRYVSSRRAYGGLEQAVGLVNGGVSVSVTADGKLLTQAIDGARLWVPEGDPATGRFISATGPQHLVFRMADGRAQSYQLASGAAVYERVGFWLRPNALAVMAALTALAAAATLAGVILRNRREFRENSMQSRASLVQNTQAALWLVALGLFAVWGLGTGDRAAVLYSWPGPFLVIGSACALVAGALTLVTLALTPAVWRGGRRVDSWSPLRKLFFTMTNLVYAAFTLMLGAWGAIWPWSG